MLNLDHTTSGCCYVSDIKLDIAMLPIPKSILLIVVFKRILAEIRRFVP